MMRGIKDYLRTKDDIQNLVSGVHNNLQEQLVAGLTGSARSILAASLYEATNRPILLLTHQLIHAERLYEDLLTLVDEEEVHLYPVNELLLSEMAIASPELRYRSEEHTSELQSRGHLVCRLLLEKKNQ